jgi:hypothetical protein
MDETKPKRANPDMSPEALDRRLRDVGQLYKLGIALREARPLGKVEEQAQPRGKVDTP